MVMTDIEALKEKALHCPLRKDCPLMGKTLLIVEDNKECREYIHNLLGQPCGECNLRIIEATSLREATVLLQSEGENIHAIILDLSLPDSTGIETFNHLSEKFRHPIIVFTGDTNPELWKQAIRDGASDFIVKGQESGARIFASVRAVLESRGYAQEVTQLTDRLAIIQELNQHTLGGIERLANIHTNTNRILAALLLIVIISVALAIHFTGH